MQAAQCPSPTGEDAVRAFLRSVRPPMEGLAAIFIHAGVVGAAHIEALVEMPESEQVEFLRRDLDLNAFDVRTIRLALLARKQGD